MIYDDDSDALEAVNKVLIALDWYVTELENVLRGDEDAFSASREYLDEYLNSPSCPLEAHDHAKSVISAAIRIVEAVLDQARAVEICQAQERERQAEEKRTRKIRAVFKAFVVVLLLITTVVLWHSATPLSAVAPIFLIFYVLLGDDLPLRLAASLLKKDDGER